MIFPFSDTHCAEASKLKDDSQREWHGNFWDEVGRGYRYVGAKDLWGEQLEDVFRDRQVRFSSHLGVILRQMPFYDHLKKYDAAQNDREEREMREVVYYWHTLEKREITGGTRCAEIMARVKISRDMFAKIRQGSFPSMREIQGDSHSLFTRVFWLLSERDGVDPHEDVVNDWMANNLHRVPALLLETCLLETLAEDYAANECRNVEKSALHTDSHDFAALSNYLPYSDAGIFDNESVSRLARAIRKDCFPSLKVWPSKEVDAFNRALQSLPYPEAIPTPETEPCQARRTLLFLPEKNDPLIKREAVEETGEIYAQILPQGGMKVSSETANWSELLGALKTMTERYAKECGMTAWVYAMAAGEPIAREYHDFGMWQLNRGLDERIAALPQ